MSSAAAPGVCKWSTDDVPQSQRLDNWVCALAEGAEPVEVSIATNAGFGASVESAHCGEIVVRNLKGSAQQVRRTKAAIARSTTSCFYLLSSLDAPWGVGQDDGVSLLLPGDCMLLDNRRPYETHFSRTTNNVSLHLPVAWIESWLTDPEANCGHRIDAEQGWGQTLSSFVRQLTPDVAAAPPLPAKVMTDQLGALLALAADGFARNNRRSNSDNASTAAAFVQKAIECIQQRHAEFGLTAQVIARELFISERTLHRYFAQSGKTFLQHLTTQRMTVAEGMLRDARFDRLTVSEIGRRVGFADASHFIRQCRASLGTTPALFRRSR